MFWRTSEKEKEGEENKSYSEDSMGTNIYPIFLLKDVEYLLIWFPPNEADQIKVPRKKEIESALMLLGCENDPP